MVTRLVAARGLIWLLLALLSVLPLWAQQPSEAPESPEFAAYRAAKAQGKGPKALGDVPLPVDVSHMVGKRPAVPPGKLPKSFDPRGIDAATTGFSATDPRAADGYAAGYDLRADGKVTAVRNQGSAGACWSFATYGSMESCLLPGETTDFSENHLKNTHGFDYAHDAGGNAFMATAYLARWAGPVFETDDPYNPLSGVSPGGLVARKHIQNIIYLPGRATATDNDAIKQAILTYGAVHTNYYHNDAYYSAAHTAYYNAVNTSTNHAVTVVGWDDTFPASNFLTAPAGDGAFLIKNSWGDAWGAAGYFYISYYDTSLGKKLNAVYYAAEATTNYDHNYQYDPLGWASSVGYGSDTGWLANVFTAGQNEWLKAASFYATSVNTAYEIFVYRNPSSGPTGGTALAHTTGTLPYSGYYTIPLAAPVSLPAGTKFSVVVKLTTPGYQYPLAVEKIVAGYSSGATAAAGQSYLGSNGTNWTDATLSTASRNVCVKGFSSNNVLPAVTADTYNTPASTPLVVNNPGVLANDSDAEGATLTATKTGNPAHGTVTLNANGSFTYTPENGWSGDDSFTYTASDGMDTSAAATVTITVTAPVVPQPDLQIKGPNDGDFRGAHVYNDDATQTTTATTAGVVSYNLLLGNDGTAADDLAVSGPAGAAGWLVRYFDAREGGGEITDAVTGAGWTAHLDVAAQIPLRVEVAPDGAVIGGASYTATVTAVSGTDGAKADHVLATTTKQALQSAGLLADTASPVLIGTTIHFTASKVGGGTPEYRFVAGTYANGVVTYPYVLPAWQASNAFTWVPDTAGAYMMTVFVREQGTTTPTPFARLLYVVKAPITAVALAVSPASAQPWDRTLTLTATPTGGLKPEYQFKACYREADNSISWVLLQAYGASNVWTGKLPQGVARSYTLYAYAREQGTLVNYLAYSPAQTFITKAPMTALALEVTPSSPQPWDRTLTAKATITGGAKPEYLFKASYRALDNSLTWITLQAYGTSNTWTGKLPQDTGRSYTIYAYAREQGTTGNALVTAPGVVYVTKAPLTALAVATTPGSPVLVGTPVTVRGVPTGGALLEYQFKATYTDVLGVLQKLTLQDYSAADSWTGMLPVDAPRAYTLYVYAREQGTTVTYLKSATQAFVTRPPLSAVALACTPPPPQLAGTPLMLKATPTGGAKVEYEFKAKYTDGLGATVWITIQPFTLNGSTVVWTPADAYYYRIYLTAREQGATAAEYKYASQNFNVQAP